MGSVSRIEELESFENLMLGEFRLVGVIIKGFLKEEVFEEWGWYLLSCLVVWMRGSIREYW